MSLPQRFHHANTDCLVREEDVAGAEYEYVQRARPLARVSRVGQDAFIERRRGHSAFTRTTSPPLPSSMWMAQARQGSKECTVRITSSGFSGSATGLPTSDAS